MTVTDSTSLASQPVELISVTCNWYTAGVEGGVAIDIFVILSTGFSIVPPSVPFHDQRKELPLCISVE